MMSRGLTSNKRIGKKSLQLSPLTQPQQRIWYMDIMNPGTSISTIAGTIRIRGQFDVNALVYAMNEVIRQNEAFRIRITTINDTPQQYVEPHSPKEFPWFDHSNAENSEQSALEWVTRHIKQPIVMMDSDLFEFVIIKISEQEHWYNIKVHHIVTDGVAMNIAVNQITQIYLEYLKGVDHSEDSQPSYLDYLETERDYEASKRYEKDKAYWFDKFRTLPEAIGLKQYNPVAMSTEAARASVKIPDHMTQNVIQFCATHNVSLFTFFLGAFYIYLHKVTHLHDIAIGTAFANRTTKKEKETFGMYVSTVATRALVDPATDLLAFMKTLSKEQASILRHQRYPYNKLIQDLKDIYNYQDIQRLFGITVQYETMSWLENEGISYQVDHLFAGHTGNDFDVSIIEMLEDQQFLLQIDYRTQLFDEGEISQIFKQYLNVVEQITQRPECQIRQLSLIGKDEADTVLHVFNRANVPFSKEKTIHQWFEEQVERTPDQWAVVYEGDRLTYQELNAQANRLARTLRAEGLGPDQLVGLMADRSLEMIVGILGILKAGGAYIPIDPEYPEERIRFMLEDSGAKLLLIKEHLHKQAAYGGRILSLDDAAVYHEDGSNLEHITRSNHLAYVIYTSGTTGKPKGVMVEHQGLGNLRTFFEQELAINKHDRIVQFASLSFDTSIWEIYMALFFGATLYIPSSSVIMNYSLFARFMTDNGITIATLPPTYAVYLEPAQLPGLKKLITGGSAASVQLVQAWQNHVQYFNAYGPTEDSIVSTVWWQKEDSAIANSVSIGRPICNHYVYIVDENNELLPVGVAGELCLGGVGLARGYLNRPDLTTKMFVNNPFIPGERMYRTGDLAKWLPDGNIEYLGRIDHQVKIRGYRIELSEIEAQMMKGNSIQETIVIAIDDAHGQKQLAAYFVAGKKVPSGEIRAHLAQELPAYMIPSYFVQLDQMPLTPNGKIDRKALPSPHVNTQSGIEYAAPRTEIEQLLADILQKVLGVESVGIYDNFFELGGDSIKSIQAASRLFQEGYKLETRDFFQYPTISELSIRVQSVRRTGDQGEIVGAVRLSPIQRWLFEQQPSESHHFNQALMLTSNAGFDEAILRTVAQKIAEHHDALRLVFREADSGIFEGWNRGVNDGALFSLDVIDLRDAVDSVSQIEAKANELQSSINLSEGPLMKLGLFHCTDGDHLLIVIHHLAVDGISWRILIEDLANSYAYASKGEELRLPLKTDSYQLWSEQLVIYANSTEIEAEIAYWNNNLQTGFPAIPKDMEEEDNFVNDSAIVTIQWTEQETEQLLKLTHRAYRADVNDLLLTALASAVLDWSGVERIAVNLEGHGREQIIPELDISRTVGWFTSQFPVVFEMTANQDIAKRIKNVKEKLRQIPHKGIGYGILRYLAGSNELSSRLQPEIGFNYLGQFDQDLAGSDLQLSPYSAGSFVSGQARRHVVLDLNGMITNNILTFTISYSVKQYHHTSMARLAECFKERLREMIAHCVLQESTVLTPSDVTLKGFTVEELDNFMEASQPIGEVEDIYPLSPMQKGMFFYSLMNSQSGVYFQQVSFDLMGSFRNDIFEQSLNAFIQRHPILRANFNNGWKDQPLQVVFRSKKVEVRVEDLRGYDYEQRQALKTAAADLDKRQSFDLTKDTLIRVKVLRIGDEEYHVLWSFHHIIMDGWCVSLMVKEVFDTYFSILEQRHPELLEAAPYSRYIEWLESQNRLEAAEYWSGYLEGYDSQTVLPRSDLVKNAEGYQAVKRTYMFGKELTERMNLMAAQQQVTVNILLQAVWGVILQKYSNSQDVVFGSVVSGRSTDIPGIETMIGLFINTIPVRIRCEPETLFADLLKWNHEQMLDSRAYETFPLYDIQALTKQGQDLIHHIMVFESYPVDLSMEQSGHDEEDGFTISNISVSEQTNYDFNLSVTPGDDICIDYEYNALTYDEAGIERIHGHLVHLLEQVTDNAIVPINELNLVNAQEKRLMLEEFSGKGAEGLEQLLEKPFHVYVEEQAQRTPEHIAVICADQKLTYSDLNRQANRLAVTLRSFGVGRESVVGVLADRCVELIVACLAIWKAGGAYVPLDPDYPSDRIHFMLEDSAAAVLLTQSHLLHLAQSKQAEQQTSRVILCIDDKSIYQGDSCDHPYVNEPQDLAYVIYTSGTTGRPKGVMIEHHSLMSTAVAIHRDYRLTEFPVRLLQLASFSFDVFTLDMIRTLMNGGSMIICPKEDRLDPERLYGYLQDYQITVVESTPALIVPFMEHIANQGLDISFLRLLITGSDSCSLLDFRKLLERFGSQVRIVNSYGVTEATIDSSFYEEPLAKLPIAGNVPIGKPISSARFYILDENLNPVPIGMDGELCIGGPGVARGYLNQPELTAKKFIANPYLPGERLYRTGDLARWMADGNVDFIGRIDHQVKIRGYRIELGEIESAMLRFSGVRQAVVTDFTDDRRQKYLCGYAVTEENFDLTALQSYLHSVLPAHAVPARLMLLEQIPLTPNGKVNRKALPLSDEPVLAETEYAAPRTAVERTLVGILQDVLGVRIVGIRDHFFELGGDSIKALQVASRLLQAGYKLEIKDLFQHPTLGELSSYIRTAGKIADQSEVTGAVVATPILETFFEQKHADMHHYNQAMMFYRQNGFEETALRKIMQRMVEHHDALRMVVRNREQGHELWNRGIRDGVLFTLDVFDLTNEANVAASIESNASRIQAGTNLEEGPLAKLGLFRCTDGDHLLVVIHHAVIDDISWRIIIEDLAAGYEQAVLEKPIHLPKKTDSFKLWSEKLLQYAASADIEKERVYWESIAQVPFAQLPKDHECQDTRLKDSGRIVLEWSERETHELLKRVHQAYHTNMNDLLLTALGLTVRTCWGIDRILVQLEADGRGSIMPDVDISRTVGCFTSMYPVVIEVGKTEQLAGMIKQVKEGLRQIPHKGIGYGILKYLTDDMCASGLTLKPEISFNFMGSFDQDFTHNGLTRSPFSKDDHISGNAYLENNLEISSMVTKGILQIIIRYNSEQYHTETMERFAALYKSSVQQIITHCLLKEQAELTPSDVLLEGLTIEDLDRIQIKTSGLGEVENVYALTPMQKGMLFHSMLDPQLGAYFEQGIFDVTGSFDIEAFEQSLDILMQRHEVLRTNVYRELLVEPVQVVFRSRKAVLHVEDLRGMNESELSAYMEEYARRDREHGFNLEQDTLMRVAILRTGEEKFRFVWSSHHIVMDGWCLSLVTKEVFESYFALASGFEPVLPEVQPYSQYIKWLEDRNQGASAAYWENYLAGYEQQTIVPSGKLQVKGEGYVSQRLEVDLGTELTEQIQRTAIKCKVTINTLLQSAWGILLQRYNGCDDVVFGSVVSGRPEELPGVEQTIGLFINTIPVRIQCSAEDTFADVVRKTQEHAIASHEYDTYPLYEIQGRTQQKQDLIQHIVAFENYPVEVQMEQLGSKDENGIAIKSVRTDEQTNYPFNLVVLPGASMKINVGYNALIYDQDTVARIQGHLIHLLQQAVTNPNIKVHELEVITPNEKTQIFDDFNNTAVSWPRDKTIHQLLEEQVDRTPDQIAVVYEGKQLSYQELNERANRLARTIRGLGVQPDQLIGIMADRSLDMVVGILAILKAGGAYVPIDPGYPEDRIQFMLEDSKVQVLLLQEHLRELVPFTGSIVLLYDDMVNSDTTAEDGSNLEPVNKPTDLAYVIYTSGTTGKPKGTLIEHKNVVRLLFNSKNLFDFGSADTWTMFHSFCFDFSVWEMYGALLYGGKLVIVPSLTAKSPAHFLELLEEEQVTILNQTPTYFYQLMNEALTEGAPELSVRKVIFGGEALSPQLLRDWRAKYPQTQLINMYGITETTVHVTYKEITEMEISQEKSNIGLPIPTLKVFVLDANRRCVPIGITGEMYVAGDGLARGYLHRPELTSDKFVVNPFEPDKRMYRTGDLARWQPDGSLEYMGRIDHQVKVRGHRIEIAEIEARLLEDARLDNICVIPWKHESGQLELCAYFTSRLPCEPSEIREPLLDKLPDYMIPAYFIRLERFPLTSNGKTDRNALPAPSEFDIEQLTGSMYVQPRNEQEQTYCDIWSEVLGRSPIGVKDDFFLLGGDSMKAVRIVSKMENPCPLAVLFKMRTIENLVVWMEENGAGQPSIVVRLSEPLPDEQTKGTLLCVPYGGGGSISFRALHQSLAAAAPLVQVWSVEPPQPQGQTRTSVAELAELCLQDLEAEGALIEPLHIYGHCAGSALALELTRQIEMSGFKVELLYMGGALHEVEEAQDGGYFPTADDYSDEEIMDFLGSIQFNFQLEGKEAGYLLSRFRRDCVISDEYFRSVMKEANRFRIQAPICCIVGDEDPVTMEYEAKYTEWSCFTDHSVELEVIRGGGHYFNESHAAELCKVVTRRLERKLANQS